MKIDPTFFSGIEVFTKRVPLLKNGDPVTIRVIGKLADSKWKISIKGSIFTAVSSIELREGETVPGKILFRGTRMFVQIESQQRNAVLSFLRSAGLNQDSLNREICRAFMQAGLSLNPKNIAKIRAFIDEYNVKKREEIRLLVMLVEKELPLEKHLFRSVQEALQGSRQDGEDESGADKRENEDDAEGNRDRPKHDQSEQRRREKRRGGEDPKSQYERDIHIKNLKDIVSGKGRTPAPFLSLFNHSRHKKKGDTQWCIVPFSFESGGIRFSGSVRILLNPLKSRYEALVLDVKDDVNHWSFSGKRDKKDGLSFRVYGDAGRTDVENTALLQELKRKLGKIGVRFDDNIKDVSFFNGFLPEDSDSIFRGVDERI